MFFYRGMHDLLDFEGDDVEDVFCLTFEVSSNFYTSLGTRDKIITNLLHAKPQFCPLCIDYSREFWRSATYSSYRGWIR